MKKEDLKIVFFGTPDFAVESLDCLVKEGYNIAAVVTMPDKPAGRGHKLLLSPVKQYALAHNLRLLQPFNLKAPEFIDELQAIEADLFIVIAFRMLPEAVWGMPPMGTFNLHASLLPRYRGAAPINWAIINGDTRTGVTTFFLKHEIDTGDVIQQEAIDILPTDNAGELHDKLMHLGARLTLDTVQHIIAGDLQPIPQEQMLGNGIEPAPAPKIFKETCKIDWNKNADEIVNLIRGLSPYPAAWCYMGENTAKILSAAAGAHSAALGSNPGDVSIEKGHVYVRAANNGIVELLSLQPQGKKAMTAAEFANGLRSNQLKLH